MTTPMTPRQRQLAEEHMDLVPRMVAALTKGFSLSSDQRRELCQTGYLALCRAAVSCRDGYDFPPYANAAIRNAIYDSWRRDIREKDRLCPLMEDQPDPFCNDFWRRDIREKDRLCPLMEDQPDPFCKEPGRSAPEEGPDAFVLSLKDTEAGAYLETLKAAQCSTIQKGIEALCFQMEGYSSKELSAHYRAPANHIRAWQSKARRFLAKDATLCALLSC